MDKCDIFISYSRRDKYQVDKIVDVLKFRGYKVWIDIDGIESGEAFRKTIVEAIENSSIMLFFSSDASNKSKWTTKEISLGVEYNKYIIPIKLDKASYNKSIIFDLIDLDYIDMSEERLVEASVQKLMRTIISKIGTRDYVDSDNYAHTIIAVPNVSIHEERQYESMSNEKLEEHARLNDCSKLYKFLFPDWEQRSILNMTFLVVLDIITAITTIVLDYLYMTEYPNWSTNFLGWPICGVGMLITALMIPSLPRLLFVIGQTTILAISSVIVSLFDHSEQAWVTFILGGFIVILYAVFSYKSGNNPIPVNRVRKHNWYLWLLIIISILVSGIIPGIISGCYWLINVFNKKLWGWSKNNVAKLWLLYVIISVSQALVFIITSNDNNDMQSLPYPYEQPNVDEYDIVDTFETSD